MLNANVKEKRRRQFDRVANGNTSKTEMELLLKASLLDLADLVGRYTSNMHPFLMDSLIPLSLCK